MSYNFMMVFISLSSSIVVLIIMVWFTFVGCARERTLAFGSYILIQYYYITLLGRCMNGYAFCKHDQRHFFIIYIKDRALHSHTAIVHNIVITKHTLHFAMTFLALLKLQL